MINQALTKKFQQAVQAQAQLNAITNDNEMCQNVQRVAEVVASILCRLATAKGFSLSGQPSNMKFMSWNIDLPLDNETSNPLVTINWEDHWSYGGNDSGSFSFPLSYITDDSTLLDYIKSSEIMIRHLENEAAERRLEEKIAERNRLRAEVIAARKQKDAQRLQAETTGGGSSASS